MSLDCFSGNAPFFRSLSINVRKLSITFSRFSRDDKEQVVAEVVLIMGSEVGDADDADVDGAVGMGHVIGASSPLNGALGGAPLIKGCNLGGEEAISENWFDFGGRVELESVLEATREGQAIRLFSCSLDLGGAEADSDPTSHWNTGGSFHPRSMGTPRSAIVSFRLAPELQFIPST